MSIIRINTAMPYEPGESARIDGCRTVQILTPVALPWSEHAVALAGVITMLPILVLFVFAPRYLVRGQTLGAVKG